MADIKQKVEEAINKLGVEDASVSAICTQLDDEAVKYDVEEVRRLAIEIIQSKLGESEDSEDANGSEEESGSDRETSGTKPRKRQRVAKAKAKGPAEEKTKEQKQLQLLRKMERAAGIGPIVYKGLKELPDKEQVTTLSDRLKDRGAEFKGLVPTLKEISEAQEKRERLRDLEDIDPSNIVTGPRRTRSSNPYARPRGESTAEEDGNEGSGGSDNGDSGSDSDGGFDRLSFASEESDD